MAKQPSSPNQNVILTGVLLLLVGFASIYYFFMPQLITARTNQAAAQATKDGLISDIATLQKATTDIGAAEFTLSSQGVNFGLMSQYFPTYEDVPNLYLQMENLIQSNPKAYGVTYQIGTPLANTSAEGSGINVPIVITAIGQYTDLESFIINLQTATRPLSFTEVSFTQYTPSVSDKNAVPVPAGSYSLSLTGYVRAEKLSASYASKTAPQ